MVKILDKPLQIERIFRASEHNFRSEAFHHHCDNRNDTLVLIETEFGNKIGGFTHYPWLAPSDWQKVNDAGRKSFLFSLSMKEKFIPMEDDQLICYRKDLGPTFGRGYDLHASDRCNINRDSYANFPYNYNREENKLERNG